MTESNVLMWLDELRFCTESYEPVSRPLSGGGEISLLFRRSVADQAAAWASRDSAKRSSGADRTSAYENLWDCSSDKVNNNSSANSKGAVNDSGSDRTRMGTVRHAEECRVSVVFQDCEDVEDIVEPVKIENIELFLTKDVLEWITDLWYSSEEEDVEEFEEFEKYQQERVDNRSPTPKFPVVPEVQLRKSNSLKPNRGSSRSNTIHIVRANPDHTQKDILISGPLKLTWLNTGQIEIIDRGAVVYRNGMLEIRYDANKPRIEMKMNSTMKNNKIWEFSNTDQSIRVAVDRQHQITMGSPRERRKSVEEESPKNINKQNILIKLLRRRSDKQLLERKGIFKNEDIFGNKLSGLYESSKIEIPEFVRRAVELIETDKNIKSEHIYRLSGNMATIQKIRLKIDGKNYKVLDEYRNDVDVLTGCLKLFYRELVEPLIPFKTFEDLYKITAKSASPDRDKLVKGAVKNMKTPHRENLQFLIHHLLIVESYKQYNKMTIQSLSIVWGPSMLWYPGVEKCPAYSPYEFSMLVNGVLELILTTYQADFESNLQTLSKNDSRGVSWKDLDTISEESSKKSPSGSASSKWPFGLRKSDSKDKLTASNWSLTDTKKDKPSDGHFGKSLESLPISEIYPNIPKLIVQMTELIEKNPKAKGLYLKPANKDALGKFKKKFQKNKYDVSKMDPLDAAWILPKLFQDLEAPLVPIHIYNEFVDYFDELDNMQKSNLIRENIGVLNAERQATIEYLVLHVLKVLDCQDDDCKGHTRNAWLPVFSNSSVTSNQNYAFLHIILNIYQSRGNTKDALSFSLPLKDHFEHRFNFKNEDGAVKTTYTRISDSSISESVYSDVDSIETHSRCNSANLSNDLETSIRDVYRSSVSVDETRKAVQITGKNFRENINNILSSRGKMSQTELMVKVYNPFADNKTRDATENIEINRTIGENVLKGVDKPTMSTFKNANVDDTKISHGIRNQNAVDDNPMKDVDITLKDIRNNFHKDVDKPGMGSVFKNFNFSHLKRKADKNIPNITDKSANDINKLDAKSNITIAQEDVDKTSVSTFKNINFAAPKIIISKIDSSKSNNDTSSNDVTKILEDYPKKVIDKPPTSTTKKFNFGHLKRNADKPESNIRKISPVSAGISKNADTPAKDIKNDIVDNKASSISKISISNPILHNTLNDIDMANTRRPSIDKPKISVSPILNNRKDIDLIHTATKRPSIEKSKINSSPVASRKQVDASNRTTKWPSIDKVKASNSPVLGNRKNVDTSTRRPSTEKLKSASSPILGNQRKNIDIANTPTKPNTRKNVDTDNRRPSVDRLKTVGSPILGNSRKNINPANTPERRPSVDNTKRTESYIKSDNTSADSDDNVDTASSDSKKGKSDNKPEFISKSNIRENDEPKKDVNKISLGLRSNLNKIMAAQTLENARARADMTQKKT